MISLLDFLQDTLITGKAVAKYLGVHPQIALQHPQAAPERREAPRQPGMHILRRTLDLKDDTWVEYTLKTANKPIGVATYSYYDSLPENMRSLLPPPDEIAKIIHGLGGNDND